MITLFCGFDKREAIGFHVFVASVLERASVPVSFVALDSKGLPQGTNTFTFSRFLVPWLMGFRGRAIFLDACDMLMLSDVAELEALFDPRFAVQCVQHVYQTRHPQKYIGTPMQCPNRDYPRKNWASLMLINCAHPAWRLLKPEQIREFAIAPVSLLSFDWLHDSDIGALPPEWNRLVDEGQPVNDAKLMHWTAGVPFFEHYKDAPGADLWRASLKHVEGSA